MAKLLQLQRTDLAKTPFIVVKSGFRKPHKWFGIVGGLWSNLWWGYFFIVFVPERSVTMGSS
jgi:hypothetical protein